MLVLKGRIIDGTGQAPIEHGAVCIEGNKIIAVYDTQKENMEFGENCEIIDVYDGTILPGFIDVHTHLGLECGMNAMMVYATSSYEKTCYAVRDMAGLLQAGFTSIREPGGFGNYLAKAQKNGIIMGPRITSAGALLSQTSGHGDLYTNFPVAFHSAVDGIVLADGVDEVRKACRLQFRSGAEFIKIFTTGGVFSVGDSQEHRQYTDSEIRAAVEEAEMHGTYVATHAHSLGGIKSALRCGVKSIEHASDLDDEAIEMCLKADAWIVPTCAICNCLEENLGTMDPAVEEKLLAIQKTRAISFSKAYKAGVKIGFGTDLLTNVEFCKFGETNLREFRLLHEIGLTPMETIVAATKTGSQMIMKDNILGTLTTGKLADIVVCEGNPLEDINLLTDINNIKAVIQDGKFVKKTLM